MRLSSRSAIAVASIASIVVMTTPRAAFADDTCQPRSGLSPCIDADNLWMHAGAGPFLSIGSTTTLPDGAASFGFGLSYLSRPIGLRVASADPNGVKVYAIDNVLDATLTFGLGVTDRLEIDFVAPFTFLQSGAGVADIVGSDMQLVRSSVRDLRFGMAFAILKRPRVGPIGGYALTSRLEFAAPTGSPGAFAGSSTMTFVPSLAFDWRPFSRLDVAAEIGARVRGQADLANATMGSQLSGALGASFDVIQKRRWLTVGAEAFGLYTLADQGPTSADRAAGALGPALVPAEWIVSVTSAPLLAGDVSATLGGGGPIPFSKEPALTNPRFRFDFALRYAPSGHDEDGDGVLDRDDKCPDVPEDRDGFEDKDGCPDPDNDKDGIPDELDKCRDAAEDFDGFEDKDGCPDLDDDKDGVPDSEDKCRNEPEDKDGFEDKDGCPDLDNDKDGIPDEKDRCPNDPEDFDGFQDRDGCPEPDNDRDGILDVNDKCPNDPEDKDGFEDKDGCPDPDNDKDGILDAKDKCPLVAETINGVEDEDGCPEQGATSRVSWKGDHAVIDKMSAFVPGKATISKELEKELEMIAQLVRGRAPLASVLVEAYPDRPGDASAAATTLAADRAAAVRNVFVAAGIPADRITAAAGDASQKRPAGAPLVDVTARATTRESPATPPTTPGETHR